MPCLKTKPYRLGAQDWYFCLLSLPSPITRNASGIPALTTVFVDNIFQMYHIMKLDQNAYNNGFIGRRCGHGKSQCSKLLTSKRPFAYLHEFLLIVIHRHTAVPFNFRVAATARWIGGENASTYRCHHKAIYTHISTTCCHHTINRITLQD